MHNLNENSTCLTWRADMTVGKEARRHCLSHFPRASSENFDNNHFARETIAGGRIAAGRLGRNNAETPTRKKRFNPARE